MNLKPFKVIVFDLGDVIINIDFNNTYNAFAKLSGLSLEATLGKFEELQVFDRYEKGSIKDEEFLIYMQEQFAPSSSLTQVLDAWNAILMDIPVERIEQIKELRKQYPVYILSNTSNLHIIGVNKILYDSTGIKNLNQICDKPFYSYEMGLRKPSIEIYHHLLKEINCEPSDVLFLDDNKDNVLSAQTIGIQVVLVTKQNTMLDILRF